MIHSRAAFARRLLSSLALAMSAACAPRRPAVNPTTMSRRWGMVRRRCRRQSPFAADADQSPATSSSWRSPGPIAPASSAPASRAPTSSRSKPRRSWCATRCTSARRPTSSSRSIRRPASERWRYDPKIVARRALFGSDLARRVVVDRRGRRCRQRLRPSHLHRHARCAADRARRPHRAARAATSAARGSVDLTQGVRDRLERGNYLVTSPPAIYRDIVIVGSAIGDNGGVELERGIVRAFDVRSGALRWSWDPIPTSSEDATRRGWQPQSAQRTGAANAWSMLSVDAGRGLVFVPTGSASPDFFGGERTGDNSYANSLVALRADTGAVVWHRQLVHHDLWDYDVAGAADADRHRARRQIDSRRRAGNQDRHAVRLRSRDRRAGVRGRRAARAAVAMSPAK